MTTSSPATTSGTSPSPTRCASTAAPTRTSSWGRRWRRKRPRSWRPRRTRADRTVVSPIPLSECSIAATGISRPEDVAITQDGRVLVSDASAAVSELRPDGSVVRIGDAKGEPTGINMLPDGSVVIGNFSAGLLPRLDLGSGEVTVLADGVGGQPLTAVNYPLVGKDGTVWASCSARQDPAVAMATGAEDGYIFRLAPDGTTSLVADGLPFPNCM